MGLYIFSFLISIIFWIWGILKYDKYEREPLKSILFVFIVGGLISSIPAGIFNQAFIYLLYNLNDPQSSGANGILKTLTFYGFVGINEEVCKVIATVLLIRNSKNFNEPADALIYSMTVGFGFSVFENIDYATKLGLDTFFYRQLNAVPLHIGLATIWGMGIARAKFINKGKYFSTLVPYIFIAALLHFIYNFSVTLLNNSILSLIVASIIALILILYSIRRLKFYQEESPFSNLLFCHHCGTGNNPDARLCYKCGQKIQLEFYNLCNNCNGKVDKSATFCYNCGSEQKI